MTGVCPRGGNCVRLHAMEDNMMLANREMPRLISTKVWAFPLPSPELSISSIKEGPAWQIDTDTYQGYLISPGGRLKFADDITFQFRRKRIPSFPSMERWKRVRKA